MPYVFSTLTADQNYQNYELNANNAPIHTSSVMVKGGSGVANDRLITPLGVMTQVSDSDYEELKKNSSFLGHEKLGFIVVQKKQSEPEKVASGMQLRDKSAPITPSDYAPAKDEQDLRLLVV